MKVSLTGNDTVIIGGRVLADFADGAVADLTFPNELFNVKTGKNGNSIFAFNNQGVQCDLKLRVLRASDDDNFLNDLVQLAKQNPAGFELLDGQLVKRVGDGQGNISNDSYLLGGGVPTRQVPAQSDADGGTEQSVAVYEFKFTNANRAIL